MRRTLNQRNERRSKSASSSSRPPEREVSRCYKCKRITLDQSAICSFCDRTCCQAHKKLMDCCQRWKCEQCTCFCKRDKLRTMRAKRGRAQLKGEGKNKKGDKRGRSAACTPGGDASPRSDSRRDSPAGRRSVTEDPKKGCVMYTRGKCTKSHAECPLVHNPRCYWHKLGKCKKGAKCLFPHRAMGGRRVRYRQLVLKRYRDTLLSLDRKSTRLNSSH